ncbi:MAG TPA: hypothetical protein VME86_11535 [Acidobacteriaceae bacterium]|nr:hypothetical protein [Acidobacteriaceae bacterium]HUB00562.1 hypothetical protein [Terracidiphilus sp.]
MQRGIAILFILFFSAGPLVALSPASDDAYLPACCRRDGMHHCAMRMAMMAARTPIPPGAPPVVGNPSHCPYYPHHLGVWSTPAHALLAAPAVLAEMLIEPHSPGAARATARFSQLRTRSVRGPPAVTLV